MYTLWQWFAALASRWLKQKKLRCQFLTLVYNLFIRFWTYVHVNIPSYFPYGLCVSETTSFYLELSFFSFCNFFQNMIQPLGKTNGLCAKHGQSNIVLLFLFPFVLIDMFNKFSYIRLLRDDYNIIQSQWQYFVFVTFDIITGIIYFLKNKK